MHLIQVWKNSLSLFLPQNLKLFSLVTLKSIISTYRVWLTYFGWALVLFFAVDFYFPALHVPGFIFVSPFGLAISASALLRLFGWFFLLFTLYLSVRPSLRPKNFAYFTSYTRYFIYFFLVALLITWINLLIVFLIYSGSPTHAYGVGMSALLVFFSMFLLDADGSFISAEYSVFRGFKMFLYNYPFSAIVGVFFIAFMHLGAKLFLYAVFLFVRFSGSPVDPIFTAEFAERLFYLLALPIPVCFITNYYIKKVHEQYILYF